MLVAPLSVAGGAVGFADYLQFVWTTMTPLQHNLVAAARLRRRRRRCCSATSTTIGRLAVVMLVVVLVDGRLGDRRRPRSASRRRRRSTSRREALTFDAQPADERRRRLGARDVQLRRLQPRLQHRRRDHGRRTRTMPRSIVLSIVIVVVLYIVMSMVILGHDPVAGSAADADDRVAVHRADVRGSGARAASPAIVMTALILFVAAASLYATILGYSRIPFAAARDGEFFTVFAPLHPTKHFPHVSLLTIGARLDPVLLLLARAAGELADPGADPAAVHLAVRGGDPAAALPPGHPAAVHDVALSAARARLAGAVALHLPRRRRWPASCFSVAFLAVAVAAYALFDVTPFASRQPPQA